MRAKRAPNSSGNGLASTRQTSPARKTSKIGWLETATPLLANKSDRHAIHRITRRQPDVIIGNPSDPYLRRWHILPKNPFFNIYLHHFLKSDDDRALHDHPWWNVSLLLSGEYTEHTIPAGGVNVRKVYRAGDLKFRRAKSPHRIELHAGPCWTLFITGPRIREWGFHCTHGWRHWRDFTNPENPGQTGRGCE